MGFGARKRSAKIRPCSCVRRPEGAAAAPIPSTKIAVIRSMRLSLNNRNIQNILNVEATEKEVQ
jgi:hypothetical protein